MSRCYLSGRKMIPSVRRYQFNHFSFLIFFFSLPCTLSQSFQVSQLSGREGYRQAIQQRLIPSLRAFNPTLILLSIGFDAAAGDVGNTRQIPGEGTRMGIDLLPEDFAWATTEIMKIADICCSGRLVSVLEGGYGEYAALNNRSSAVAHVPTTRGAARQPAPAPAAVVETEKV